MEPRTQQIIDSLAERAGTKQFIFRKTIEVFNLFRSEVHTLSNEISDAISEIDKHIEVNSFDNGNFETGLKFSGDTLYFIMHTNVFNFPPEHAVHRTDYVREDLTRSYCGMIMIYDFLSDSIKYGRMNDIGYLIARIFVNKEGHFFVQGKRQFSFLYNDFSQFQITPETVRLLIQTAILHTIDFDLFVPPFEAVKEISLRQKIVETGNSAIKTGKRLGFSYGEND